jgi:hypothetical protein
MSVKVHFPNLPLQEAVARSGGITRENAVEAALENVRAISAEGDATIEAAIQTLEAIVGAAVKGQLGPDQLRAVLELADQIVNMAGTFHYEILDQASRSLCDIADGLLREGRSEAAPVAVHVRAMRLFSPLGAAPPAEAGKHILAELAKVAAFYNFAPLGGTGS